MQEPIFLFQILHDRHTSVFHCLNGFFLCAGDGLSSSLISAPSLLSSSLAKSAAVTIPKRYFGESSVMSHGAAAHSHVRRPSAGDDRFDDRKFNPHRYFNSLFNTNIVEINIY